MKTYSYETISYKVIVDLKDVPDDMPHLEFLWTVLLKLDAANFAVLKEIKERSKKK